MPIPVRCACGKALNAPDALAGKKAKCPGCGAVLSIPAAAPPAAKPSAPSPEPAALAPKPAAVPAAPAKTAPAKAVQKPAAPGTKAVPKPTPLSQAKTEARPAAEGEDLHAHSACPSCNSFVSKKDAICVQCGTHLVTGKQLSTVMTSEPTGPAKNIAILCLVLNLLLPGLGTLVGGGKSARKAGFLQLGMVLISVTLLVLGAREPFKEWLLVVPGGERLLPAAVYLVGIVLGLTSGLEILKNAKPAA